MSVIFKSIVSVAETSLPHILDCQIVVDIDDVTTQIQYNYDESDVKGISPQVRGAMTEWLSTNEVSPYVPPEPVGPTADDVVNERSRRLAAGFDYDFGDGPHHIGTTDADMAGWDEVTKYANALIALNDTTSEITIATDDGVVDVTALQWQSVLVASARFRQPLYQASFALQAMNPIPSDYADDKYWTT